MRENVQKPDMKRKRFEISREKDIGVKVAGKLHHDLKEVRKAAKKAKTFETQKLVKKLKGLRLKDENDPNIMECELQLKHLKLINHEAVANTALRTRLTKDKILSDNESMQIALSKELTVNLLEPADDGTSIAKVQSRLLSSKVLATEVAATLEDLRTVIVPPTDSQDGNICAESEGSGPERPKKMRKIAPISEDSDVEMGGDEVADNNDEEDALDADEWESGTVGDDEKEFDDGWESGSIIGESDGYMDDDLPLDSQGGSKKSSGKPVPIAGPSKINSKVSIGESTFLPTLSAGFIRGSDSDWSDNEDEAADFGAKKNRRGQRARRAIWEKKYGKNANHKKKEAALNAASEIESGRKRWPGGNTPANRPSNKAEIIRKTHLSEGSARPKQDSGWGQRNTPTAYQGRESRPLHPSWEAKKKLNEKQSAVIAPPGKKIIFS
ncbi:Bud-site selection protein [Lentinula aciculospora]|uniref:Bud-site selection protein n=1 Tax=Lentinula aciculospora TaxID=153920 RepID=A0A9W9AHP1_9AGAR|nr:Bud-site selection protein [Lentinula aciculospora]